MNTATAEVSSLASAFDYPTPEPPGVPGRCCKRCGLQDARATKGIPPHHRCILPRGHPPPCLFLATCQRYG